MDSLEVNKVFAAVLVAGIGFMSATLIADNLVSPTPLAHPALKIDAPTPSAAPAAEAPLPPIGPLMAKANPADGEAYVKKVCVACHSFNEGGKAGVGPNLYGVVMGPHAHMKGYSYSSAIEAKKGPWTYAELNEWLKKPSAYAPGTKMGFAGINNDAQRADVIDYLHTLSHDPAPLPPANEAPAAAAAAKAAPAKGGVAPVGTAPVFKPGEASANQPPMAARSQSTPAIAATKSTTALPPQSAPGPSGSAVTPK